MSALSPLLAASQNGTADPTSLYQQYATSQANTWGIDPSIFYRLIQQESGWSPTANSGSAYGIAQFTPGTAAQYGVDPSDPWSSLRGAAQYLSDLLKKYGGDYFSALTAYNAGPGNVDRLGAIGASLLPGADPNYAKGILGGGAAPAPTKSPNAAATIWNTIWNTIWGHNVPGSIGEKIASPTSGPSIFFSAGALVVGVGLLLTGVIWLAGYEITASGLAGQAVKTAVPAKVLSLLK